MAPKDEDGRQMNEPTRLSAALARRICQSTLVLPLWRSSGAPLYAVEHVGRTHDHRTGRDRLGCRRVPGSIEASWSDSP